jgi:hypothetical protein
VPPAPAPLGPLCQLPDRARKACRRQKDACKPITAVTMDATKGFTCGKRC